MCFSMEMDLIAGTVITAIGVPALRSARSTQELPLAVLPMAFGIHHLVEAAVWANLDGNLSNGAGRAALWAYLLFAFGVLPWFVPLSLWGLEPDRRRRAALVVTGTTGLGIATLLVFAMLKNPISVAINGHHLDYSVYLARSGGILVGCYVVVTCGSLLLSSHRPLRQYGVANIPVIAVLIWLMSTAFISLWCLWAAIASLVIVVHLSGRAETCEIETGNGVDAVVVDYGGPLSS